MTDKCVPSTLHYVHKILGFTEQMSRLQLIDLLDFIELQFPEIYNIELEDLRKRQKERQRLDGFQTVPGGNINERL